MSLDENGDLAKTGSKAHNRTRKTWESPVELLQQNTITDTFEPENNKNSSTDENRSSCPEKLTVLLDWIIRPLPDLRGVCVEGQIQGVDNFWHSTAIVDALKPKLVVTTTGSQYQLKGRINKLCTLDNGFSKSVAHAFANGFPKNWKQIISDFYKQLEDSISIIENSCTPRMQKVAKLASERKRHKSPVSLKHLKLMQAPAESLRILTPLGIVKQKLSTGDMTVTRSGRMSLPPLARWTGQHYRKIAGSSEVEVIFETDCAKNTLTTQFLHLPKKSLKMVRNKKMCSRSVLLPTKPTSKVGKQTANRTIDCLHNVAAASPTVNNHSVAAGTGSSRATVPDFNVSDKERVVPSHQVGCHGTGRHSLRILRRKERHAQITVPTTNCSGSPASQPRSKRKHKCVTKPQTVIPPPAESEQHGQRGRKRRKMDDDIGPCEALFNQSSNPEKEARPSKRRKLTPWSHQEKQLLQRALAQLNCAGADYWKLVSDLVGTRSQTECQQFCSNSSGKQISKKSTLPKSKSGRQKGDPIRGGRGTLKRKQDLRDFLAEQNDGYEDNIFDSTPFTSNKSAPSVFAVSFDRNDSEIFGVNHSCITPGGLNSTPGTLPRPKMASARKTPTHVSVSQQSFEDTTPVSINRRKVDQYIKKFIDHRNKAKTGQSVVQINSSVLDVSAMPVKSLFCSDNLPSIIVDNDDDDEEEASPYMYYWNNDS